MDCSAPTYCDPLIGQRTVFQTAEIITNLPLILWILQFSTEDLLPRNKCSIFIYPEDL